MLRPTAKTLFTLPLASLLTFTLLTFATVYLSAVYFIPRLLPARFYWDAQKISVSGGTDEYGDSFMRTAYLFNLLPPPILKATVYLLGVAYLAYLLIYCGRKLSCLIFAFLCVVATVPLNLLAPTKDTLVILVTLLAALLFRHAAINTNAAGPRLLLKPAVLFGLLCYVTYGLLIRSYFLLAVAGGILIYLIISSRSILLRGVWIGITAVLLFMMVPNLLQGQANRDIANDNAIVNQGNYNRTLFYNPRPHPDSIVSFAVNYGYSLARFCFPIAWSPTLAELFLVIFNGAYLVLSLRGLVHPSTQLLAAFSLSHLLVLVVFDPDLGAYLRHLSSYAAFPLLITGIRPTTQLAGGHP